MQIWIYLFLGKSLFQARETLLTLTTNKVPFRTCSFISTGPSRLIFRIFKCLLQKSGTFLAMVIDNQSNSIFQGSKSCLRYFHKVTSGHTSGLWIKRVWFSLCPQVSKNPFLCESFDILPWIVIGNNENLWFFNKVTYLHLLEAAEVDICYSTESS